MVNLWGPGAFDCANPSAVQPPFVPDNAPGDADDWFKNCSSPLVADGTEWRAELLNLLIANLRWVVRGSGTPDSNLDPKLLAKAIQSGGMNFAAASGTANNWTIALNLALVSYRAGTVLWLKPPATNTSTTVVATIDGLASRPVKKADGTNPAVGDLLATRWYPAFDDGTNIRILTTLPSELVFASAPEIDAGTATGKPIDPAGLFSLAKSHGQNGYQKLPGGLMLQWGKVDSVTATALTNVVFPIAFPTEVYTVFLTDIAGAVGNADQIAVRATGLSATGFTIVNDEQGTAVFWFAIGK